MKKIKSFYLRHKAFFVYIFFGILTSFVDYLVYIPLHNFLHFSATVSNVIAWANAVLFAFLTNKAFVFKSNDWSAQIVFPEFWKFSVCRITSGLLETAFLFVMVDILSFDGNIMKLIISFTAALLNYIGSKLFAFKK